jgi:hypothetical protein
MFNSLLLKSIPMAAAIAAALPMGGAVHAQGAGSSGAATSPVQSGASPTPGTTGAEVGTSKSAVTKPAMVKKAKPKARTTKGATQQPTTGTGPTEDPSRIKP